MDSVNLQDNKSRYKKPVKFLYTNNELSEKEIKQSPLQ